jgi:uncharacterized protein
MRSLFSLLDILRLNVYALAKRRFGENCTGMYIKYMRNRSAAILLCSKQKPSNGACILVVLFSVLYPVITLADTVRDLPGTPGIRFNIPLKTLADIRRHNTVRQLYDFSCGGASLAMILRYQYEFPLSEEQIVQAMIVNGDPSRIKQAQGFSLLDLKHYANAVGFDATGYKVNLEELQAFGLPAIVPVEWKGYHHFVVFRGVEQGHVVLADPAWGNLTMKAEEFEATWQNNVAFVITPKDEEVVPNRMAVKDDELLFLKDQQLTRLVSQTVFTLSSH